MIAKAIRDNTRIRPYDTIAKESLINDLCAEFKADNGSFNADRFVDACE
tara:strand:+ start:4762 stop:4908 length:147 start_codon:yes stop_codon:yes gene_type:complete